MITRTSFNIASALSYVTCDANLIEQLSEYIIIMFYESLF